MPAPDPTTPPDVLPLALPGDLESRLRAEAEAAYPHECCGLLVGVETPDRREVVEIVPAPNAAPASDRARRYQLPPTLLLATERRASETGRLILGIYHSHPDHPARPSDTDHSEAWPWYSYVIVSVARGKSAAMTGWVLNELTGRLSPQLVIAT